MLNKQQKTMKKTFKPLTVAITIAIVSLALNACGNRATNAQQCTMTPSEVVTNYFQNLNRLDFNRAATLIDRPDGVTQTQLVNFLRDTYDPEMPGSMPRLQEIRSEEILECGTQAIVVALLMYFLPPATAREIALVKIGGAWRIHDGF